MACRIVGMQAVCAAALLFNDGMKFKFDANQDKPPRVGLIVLFLMRINREPLPNSDSELAGALVVPVQDPCVRGCY